MKIAMRVVGVILILVGIVWFLQGIGVLLGSFMTGQSQYAILGVISGVIGAVLLILSSRSRRLSGR